MGTNAQAAAYYYARKRNRDAQPLHISVQPRLATVAAQTLSADTPVSQVDTLIDHGRGENSLSLDGANASDFVIDGRAISLASGVVLASGDVLKVTVKLTNTVLGDTQTQLEVRVP